LQEAGEEARIEQGRDEFTGKGLHEKKGNWKKETRREKE